MPSMRMPPWRNAMASKERADATGNGMIGKGGNETDNRMSGKSMRRPPWRNAMASKEGNNRMAGNRMIG